MNWLGMQIEYERNVAEDTLGEQLAWKPRPGMKLLA